ncbi:XrtA/PEP-CTERM system TPR-repeat protein PrsT [Vibrio salinus]|uniref:XrtA/PEP-CTERM system TPR-repeat protein PrsT n=1 Tax=Vibrio salinus TaxID=2899784 RepID=UPI001E52CB98|nr:XrtA/PEP-CTERM system TPR-repeat protein PrsT [Vibrio salinus]MCE0493279.1 PEP-CTERM system TPR-repeat protein PrsT [Vibrio salinus]
MVHQLASGNVMSQHKQNKKTTKRLSLVGLTATVILFTGLAYADNYLESAEKYLSNNEVNAAIIELKNAIQNTPKDAQPRLVLGKLYLQRGNYASAEKELSRALHLGANKPEVLPLLARALSDQGKHEDVIELVDESSISNSISKAELLGLKALSEINLGNADSARAVLKNIKKDLKQQSTYPLLAQARLVAGENPVKAIKLINQALKIAPENSDIWVLKGHLEFAQQQFNKATETYQKAYKISPDALHYSLFIARSLVYSKHFEKASPYIDKVLKISPNHPLANELKATILYSEGKYDDAKEHADKALNNGSKNIATTLISAISAYKLNLYEQANRRLKQVLPHLPEDHFARRLYIVTLMKLGYINQAIQSMDKLNVDSKDNNRFISQMSIELSKLGRDEDALTLASKAYDSDKSSSNELMLGLVKLADNDATGIKELQSAISEQPDKRKAEIGIAYYYIKLGKITQAEAVANKWLKQNADDIDALTLKGKIYQLKKQFNLAEKELKKALKVQPDFVQAKIALAQVLANQGKFPESYQQAFEAKKMLPGDESATQVLILSAKRLNKMKQALSLINKQIDNDPTNLALIHQKAEALVIDNNPQGAAKLLEDLPDETKNAKTWSLIGDIYYIEKQWFNAQRAYKKWLEMAPTDAQAYIRNISISEKTTKFGAGINLIKKATEIFPNDVRFPLMKVGLLIKSKKLGQAQRLLNTLPERIKETPYSARLQGLIYALQKDFSEAVAFQKKIFKHNPGLETAKDLASAYVLNGESQKAIIFLSKVIKDHPIKGRPLNILLADIQSKTDPENAIKLYETIIKKEPKNIIALNNLSWLYMDKNQYTKACQYSKKAFELAGKQPEIADTHGYCLLKSGNVDEATSLLERAYQLAKSNSEIALHYAESLIKENKTEQAQNVLMGVTTKDPKLITLKQDLNEAAINNQ